LDQVRWSRVKQILGDALELPASKRAAFLTEACGSDQELRQEVEALLAISADVDDFIEKPALAQSDDWLSGLIGSRIGPYRIMELLGEGGMGAVYRAVRDDDFQQQIAIKLVKRGMDTNAILRRFRAERRILARLDHPNICKLLDGGVTDDGLPYFVMEYLQGTPIQTYCRERKLSINERLNLFIQVCAAVEYSHRNLVVHRDLKAKNILVTEDRLPKLLDFGIAKLLNDDSVTNPDPTVAADRLFTPDYASPEQIRAESITTAADIYSLGVLLYEILTDHRPFHLAGLSQAEMARVVTEARSSAAEHDYGARDLSRTGGRSRHDHPQGDAQKPGAALRLSARTGRGYPKAHGRPAGTGARRFGQISGKQVFQAQSRFGPGGIGRFAGLVCGRRCSGLAARGSGFERAGVTEALWRDPRAGELVFRRTRYRTGAIAGVDHGAPDAREQGFALPGSNREGRGE
jgi:tRNA A-37 threonylcarbamoyl transferase component Bud32